MSILDNMTSAMNRGADSVGRATEKTRLKGQLSDINKRRQNLAAQLGASLYEATKNDPNMRVGRESLYDSIAALDTEREAIQLKINEIDAVNVAAATAAATFKCTVCGATMSGSDVFCSGCGTPAEQARPQNVAVSSTPVAEKACPNCGAPMAADDMFCMSCGTKIGA